MQLFGCSFFSRSVVVVDAFRCEYHIANHTDNCTNNYCKSLSCMPFIALCKSNVSWGPETKLDVEIRAHPTIRSKTLINNHEFIVRIELFSTAANLPVLFVWHQSSSSARWHLPAAYSHIGCDHPNRLEKNIFDGRRRNRRKKIK